MCVLGLPILEITDRVGLDLSADPLLSVLERFHTFTKLMIEKVPELLCYKTPIVTCFCISVLKVVPLIFSWLVHSSNIAKPSTNNHHHGGALGYKNLHYPLVYSNTTSRKFIVLWQIILKNYKLNDSSATSRFNILLFQIQGLWP